MRIFAAMKRITLRHVWLLVAQLLLLSLIMLSPGLISFITTGNGRLAVESIWISFFWLAPAVFVYLVNFYVCVPQLWFRHRYWLFGLVNAVLIAQGNIHLFYNDLSELPEGFRAGYRWDRPKSTEEMTRGSRGRRAKKGGKRAKVWKIHLYTTSTLLCFDRFPKRLIESGLRK